MAYVKKVGKKRVIKRTVKKVYKRRPKASIVKNLVDVGMNFPSMMKMTHRYVDQAAIVNTVGNTNYITYSCNGLWDPQVSIGGHQPLGFDNLTLLYNHYLCIGSRIKVTLAGLTTNANYVPIACCIQTHSSATPPYIDPILAAEQNHSKVKLMGPSDTGRLVLSSRWSAKKVFGKGLLANDELKGNGTSNPVEQTYWTISTMPLDRVSQTTTNVIIEIEYIAIWKELKTITQS